MSGLAHVILTYNDSWVVMIVEVLLGGIAAIILIIGLNEPHPCLFFALTLTLYHVPPTTSVDVEN